MDRVEEVEHKLGTVRAWLEGHELGAVLLESQNPVMGTSRYHRAGKPKRPMFEPFASVSEGGLRRPWRSRKEA